MLPNEIVFEIISYIPNIETRMNFNIIGKLSEKYEEILETTIRDHQLGQRSLIMPEL